MKKYRRLVIGGIETKVFNLILISVIALTAAFIIISFNQGSLLKLLNRRIFFSKHKNTSRSLYHYLCFSFAPVFTTLSFITI